MVAAKGPIEAQPWPDALEAFAIDGSRLHGYDVEADLAKHYRFSDVVFLALTGELPSDAQARAFEIALCFLLPVSVARAPAHATVLAGYCAGPPSGVLATAAATLSDEIEDLLDVDPAIFDGEKPLPEALRATSTEEEASVARLKGLLGGVIELPILARKPKREVALVAVLRACGFDTPLRLAAAITFARIPSVIAEAAPRKIQDFMAKYPLQTPRFVYEE